MSEFTRLAVVTNAQRALDAQGNGVVLLYAADNLIAVSLQFRNYAGSRCSSDSEIVIITAVLADKAPGRQSTDAKTIVGPRLERDVPRCSMAFGLRLSLGFGLERLFGISPGKFVVRRWLFLFLFLFVIAGWRRPRRLETVIGNRLRDNTIIYGGSRLPGLTRRSSSALDSVRYFTRPVFVGLRDLTVLLTAHNMPLMTSQGFRPVTDCNAFLV